MDYLSQLGHEFAGHQCGLCDFEIDAKSPAYVDIDGGGGDDGTAIRVHARHASCHLVIERMRFDAYMDASNIAMVSGPDAGNQLFDKATGILRGMMPPLKQMFTRWDRVLRKLNLQ